MHQTDFQPNTPSDSPSTSEIVLTVNGESRTCLVGITLPEFLEQMELNPKLVAVEYNGEILHRQFWQQTVMQSDDRLEIVTIVGGGSPL